MGIVLGYLCLVCLCLLLAKALTRKWHLEKADRFFMTIHKYMCIILVILSLLHVIMVLPVLRTRSPYVYFTGIAIIIAFILIVLLYHIKITDHTARLHLHRILALIILLCTAAHITTYFQDYKNYQVRIQSIYLQDIDISKVADNQYIGEYDAGYIYAKVRVTVLEGKIEKIDILKHRHERGQSAEQLVDNIIDTQTFPTDAVSGATNSSKVIQQAIQNALEK